MASRTTFYDDADAAISFKDDLADRHPSAQCYSGAIRPPGSAVEIFTEELGRYKQQLAEKDREIKDLGLLINELYEDWNKECQQSDLDTGRLKEVTDKLSKELEKVKKQRDTSFHHLASNSKQRDGAEKTVAELVKECRSAYVKIEALNKQANALRQARDESDARVKDLMEEVKGLELRVEWSEKHQAQEEVLRRNLQQRWMVAVEELKGTGQELVDVKEELRVWKEEGGVIDLE